MITRKFKKVVQKTLKKYPAVALIGARQVGKTTLSKTLSDTYFDLEQKNEQSRLDFEWVDVINKKQLIILDEVQSWPDVFPRIRGAIDIDRKRNGRFLLLGSVSPVLMKEVSESLAGRLALIDLPPLTLEELPKKISWKELWLYGGFPDGGILTKNVYPKWQKNYLMLLTNRDFPNWGLSLRPIQTERLLYMLAAVNGQLWNASNIGKSLGLTYHTINGYIDFLEGTFLIRRIYPYSTNIKKRLVKSPKVYWRDSGLLHAILGIANYEDLLRQPYVGASWEGFVIEQILNHLELHEIHARPYFFRTHDGHEIDLILDFGANKLMSIEIKMTSSPNLSDYKKLEENSKAISIEKSFMIAQVEKPILAATGGIVPLNYFLKTIL